MTGVGTRHAGPGVCPAGRPVGGRRDRPALEEECRCLPVFARPVAPLENVTLSPAWELVESRAWNQVPEDFAVSLPLFRRRFRARRATALLSAPWALPAGSKGRTDGLHCERESIQGSVSRETPAACKRGCARIHSDSRGTLPAEPWGARPLARGSKEVLDWSHGLCGSVAGTVRGLWARQHGPGPAPAGGSGVPNRERAGHGTAAAVQGGTGT